VQVDFNYESDAHIELSCGNTTVGIDSVSFAGRLALKMRPMSNDMTDVVDVAAYFLDRPKLDLGFAELEAVTGCHDVPHIVESVMREAVSNATLLPNVVKIATGLDLTNYDSGTVGPISYQTKPMAILRIVSASAKDVSGPYQSVARKEPESFNSCIRLSLGNKEFTSAGVSGSAPHWSLGECCDFVVYDKEQLLHLDILAANWDEQDVAIGTHEPMRLAEAITSEDSKELLSPNAEQVGRCGRVALKMDMFRLVPHQRGRNGFYVSIEIDKISLPSKLGQEARIAAELCGVTKQSPIAICPDSKALNEEKAAGTCQPDPDVSIAVVGGRLLLPLPHEKAEQAALCLDLFTGKGARRRVSSKTIGIKEIMRRPRMRMPGPLMFEDASGFDVSAQVEIKVYALQPCGEDALESWEEEEIVDFPRSAD